MHNKNIKTESRLLISELLTDPIVSKYMSQLQQEQPFTFRHSINVAYLTAEICLTKDPENNVHDVVKGALLHDIGKIKIPLSILTKTTQLTDKEFDKIKAHTIKGYEMVKDEPIAQITKDIILYHHEKNNGMGYPYQKTDEEIPEDVKIITVCDIYDALTEHRHYRPNIDYNAYEALKILVEQENIKDIVYLLLALCPDK